MTELSTDARLVTDFLAGDTSALAAIYDRYAAGLYDTAAAMLSNRHDAADMVQDVFCIAAERLSQLREPDRLKPWLYSVLRHEVYRRTKKRKRAVPVDFQDERTPDVASGYDPHAAGEAIAHEELAALVRSAASGLDERDRLVLELSVRQGLSGADLADALGVTPDQSYSLVHRMRDRVEKSLGALTVAKAGRRDCEQLDRILAGWDGELTVLLRKRVNRHIEECATCDRTRKAFAPLALFGAAPAFVLPLGLREKVLAAALPGGGAGSSGSTSSTSSSGSAPSNTTSRIRFDARHGFPTARRLGRHAVLWATTATVAVVIGGGALLGVADSDDSTGPASTTGPTTTTATTDDRRIVSGAGSVITIFGDSTGELPMVETTTHGGAPSGDAAIGGAGGPAGPPPSNTTVAPIPTTAAPVVPFTPATTDAPTTTEGSRSAPSSSSTSTSTSTSAPISVQSVQVSTTKFDFGSTTTAIKVTLRNPNSFPVSFTSSFTSPEFSANPAIGSLSAGEQISYAVTFDRAGAVADEKNFPTGSFSHSLTLSTSAAGGSSTPTRTATLYGTIVRVTATTTTTAAPVATVTVSKVTGSIQNCVALNASAVVTGKVVSATVTATYRRRNLLNAQWTTIATSSAFPLTAGPNGAWSTSNVKVQPPAGTQNVLLTVTATPSSGSPVSATGTFAQTC